ncbi:MAG: SsrA-binding protein SmpB [candidate division WOR-3 bacterium]
MPATDSENRMKPIVVNRKAYHDYHVEETYEAGMELKGTEVKSLRNHSVDLSDGYARVEGGEVFLYDVHIAPYTYGNVHNHDPKRRRRLLLSRDEIKRLFGKTQLRGLTLVPLKIYFNERGYAKVELGLCRGKKEADRREVLRRRALEREDRREMHTR